ncbi:MAG: redox-regulated ATPase YchF [Candidatus Promineifilaceae bacterium]
MGLSIGIVGLPNVGKSTVFNALTRTQLAAAENYPFCTIEPNRAVVPVPDGRLEAVARATGAAGVAQATVEFVDIAGLVRGASQGEGLGNQFLGHIRDTAAILHVVRCFADENVVHVNQKLEPRADIELIQTELILADLEQLGRKIGRLTDQAKGDKKAMALLERAEALRAQLEAGRPVSSHPAGEDEALDRLLRELRLSSAKPVIYVANVDESGLGADDACTRQARQLAAEEGAEAFKLCAQLEADLAGLDEAERAEYLALAGVSEGGLDKVIRKSYAALGLISFFTFNEKEARAWTVRAGSRAPQAAGTIHTDFERGFIRAEVMAYESFVGHGSWAAARAAGAVHQEGKEYVVRDGDVIHFRFNV